jgi:hypothetical protein
MVSELTAWYRTIFRTLLKKAEELLVHLNLAVHPLLLAVLRDETKVSLSLKGVTLKYLKKLFPQLPDVWRQSTKTTAMKNMKLLNEIT